MKRKKKSKIWSWSSFFLGLFVVGLALFIAREARKDLLVGENGIHSRNPAAVPKTLDFSSLTGDRLRFAAKKRLLDGLKIQTDPEGSHVELGNFVQLNERNQKDFACGVYNHVTLTFEAEGVAVNGEKPSLTIDGPCSLGPDINKVSAALVPVKQVLSINPHTGEFDLGGQGNSFHFLSKNNPESWPTQWALTEINLNSDGGSSQYLHISSEELRAFEKTPVFMKWQLNP